LSSARREVESQPRGSQQKGGVPSPGDSEQMGGGKIPYEKSANLVLQVGRGKKKMSEKPKCPWGIKVCYAWNRSTRIWGVSALPCLMSSCPRKMFEAREPEAKKSKDLPKVQVQKGVPLWPGARSHEKWNLSRYWKEKLSGQKEKSFIKKRAPLGGKLKKERTHAGVK